MYFLEYKKFHIIKEPLTKNCTHQTYRWTQIAVGEDKEALEEFARLNYSDIETRIINNLGA